VLSLTCDGASTNRRLQRIHGKGRDLSDRGVLYKVPNVYAPEPSHFLYFISNPIHLIKTTQNCWASKSRKLEISFLLFVCIQHLSMIVQ